MVKILKRAVSRLAGHLGYTVIPTWRAEHHPADAHLARLLDLLAIDLVVDVGANEGQFYRRLRRDVGYAGDVLSFEPVPDLAERLLRQSAREPRWTVQGAALGAQPATRMFNIMKDTQFSSFHAPADGGVLRFEGLNDIVRTVPVAIRTLDQALAPLLAARRRRIFLKLDTQGFDLEVLKGASNSLPQVLGLQFEASFESIYDSTPRYGDVIEYARNQGFLPSGIYRNNPEHFPVMIEADCLMVRTTALPGR